MKELAPGVFIANNGDLHVDLAEICRANGFEPSQENQDLLERTARRMFPGRVLTGGPTGGAAFVSDDPNVVDDFDDDYELEHP